MIEPLIVGITGTRKGQTATQLIHATGILKKYRKDGAVWMHHGDCAGSDDEMAQSWKAFGGKLHCHPPSNPRFRANVHSDASEEPKYYLNRNRDIVNDSNLMIATPAEMVEQDRGGTWSTIRYARLKGARLLIVLPDGSIKKENWG